VSKPLPEDSAYSVGFNKEAAWSLTYADALGRMGFCFEPGDEKKQVHLNSRASVEGEMPSNDFYLTARFKLALERTRQYLASCGYDVSIE
jgi:hypothetical protein